MINKILIANRGEIAVRIIRACKELDIKTVAVHSNVDSDSMHVKLADESVCIGPHNPINSYLNIPNLVSALEISGADAIHPGYGFLSENFKFADTLEQHKIKFIGPRANVIKKMGDKIQAKKIAEELGLPIIQGSNGAIKDLEEAKKISKKIGYPVLIKASGGGGGKGMKIVHEEKDLGGQIELAKNEAKKYFGSEDVFIEKYFQNPRHIEVQILSDGTNTIHLGERDCTIQRRHQKLVEETPSPVISKNERKNLLDTCVKSISNLGYHGAGTIEFIYEDGKFYFLEMNTRLQVEHPVTEVVTGVDIVKRQIEIAATNKLSLKQSEVKFSGHAIECRINAENYLKNFQPSSGIINILHQPSGPGTRVDACIFQGCKILPYYDSLIAKLICYGKDRSSAKTRLKRALDEFVINGIDTTIDLHKKIVNHKDFIDCKFDVNWLSKTKL